MNTKQTFTSAVLTLTLCFISFLLLSKATAATEKLVVIGSSTAAGNGASAPNASWVGLLKPWLLNRRGWKVENFAIAGTLTSSAACLAPGSATTRAISSGATHLIFSFPSNDATAGVAPAVTLEHWRDILQCAADKSVKVAVMSTIPRAGLTIEQVNSIAQVDKELRETLGPCFIDVKNQLLDTDGASPKASLSAGDGVHFNDRGHLVIFNQVLIFLRSKQCF
jgi:lysophospholipase L1-like esterase